MNAVNVIPRDSVRPEVYSETRFTAFRVVDQKRTYQIEIDATTMRDALNAACLGCFHKDRLIIREDQGRKTTLHVFAIRKAKARYVRLKPTDIHPTRVEDLHAEPICSFDGGFVLSPLRELASA